MDIVSLIVSLVSGAVGGNIAGEGLKEKSLGAIGNSIAGLVGGGLGATLLKAFDLFQKTGEGFDLTALLGNIGVSGISGALLLAVVSFIRYYMRKHNA